MKARALSDFPDIPLPARLPPQRAGIQSVEVGFGLLQVLAQAQGPLMLRDLAARAGMSAAKAYRYLVSFQRLALVMQDSGSTRYDLGPAALKLGLACLSRLDSVKLARQRMAPLMEQVGQTLALAGQPKPGHPDVPGTMAEVAPVLENARSRGRARAVNTLLPGVAGFCAPVFDADGHLALGMVALGSLATFDTAWDGAVAVPLKAAAVQLSDELGFVAA